MKFCPTCGKELKSGARFCSECGSQLEQNGSQNDSRNESIIYQENRKGRKSYGLLLVLMGLVFLGYFGFQYLNNASPPSYNAMEMLEECSGVYKDQTGMLTGRTGGNIEVNHSGGHLMGRGESGSFTFDLLIQKEYKFQGSVILKGVETLSMVEYDPELKRLTFSREGSPLDWYIAK